MMRRVCQLIALLAVCGPCFGQSSDHSNAAMHYHRAFDRFSTLTQREWEVLMDYDGPSVPPTPELRNALRKVQPILNDFHRGTLQQYSDFGLDFNQGFDLLMPHLGPMRQIALLSRTDIAVRLHDGDTTGATNRIAAMARSISHFSDDRTMISTLVGQGVYSLTDSVVQMGFDHAAFNAGDAMRMLHPLEALAAQDDPFGYIETLFTEQHWIMVAVSDSFEKGELAQLLDSISEPDVPFDDERWQNLSEEEFSLNVAAFDDFMNDAVEIFAMDDHESAVEAMKQLEENYLQSEHNLFSMLTSAYSKILETRKRGEDMLRTRLDTLRELAEGEIEPEHLANAAVWYLRGIELLRNADENAVTELRAFDAMLDSVPSDELRELLTKLGQDVIDEFRAGSEIRRCDFSIARQRSEFPFIPTYAPGMRDVLRLLHADAVRLIQDGRIDDAADRFITCYRVIGHFSQDDQLLSSLVSHVGFEHTHILVDAAIEEDLFDSDIRRALFTAFDRIGRADPFGYGGAIRRTREHGVDHVWRLARWDEANAERYDRLAEIIQTIDADRLLTLLALEEAVQEERRRRPLAEGRWPVDYIDAPIQHEALADVISLKSLEQLREETDALAVTVLDGEFDGDFSIQLTPITKIAQRREQARSVLRYGSALLQSPPSTAVSIGDD